MSNDYAIQTENLTKHYKHQVAVNNVSLMVPYGEVFGFLGPNGAGKTTTIAMLLGLVKPTSGHAFVLGHNIQQNPVAALRGVGAMIEHPAFYPYLSGRNNLRVLTQADGLPERCIDQVLHIVDLSHRAQDTFKTYSQGMKQRLAIAASLLSNPQLIILDEPTNGLDPAGTVEIRDLIRSLSQKGHTIFLCSHILHEVEHVCHRVAILKEGRVLAQGKVDELLRRGQMIQVRVASDIQQAQEVLRFIPWIGHVEQQQDMLVIDAPVSRASEINTFLASHNVLVAEIRAHEGSLEAFFLKIIGESS